MTKPSPLSHDDILAMLHAARELSDEELQPLASKLVAGQQKPPVQKAPIFERARIPLTCGAVSLIPAIYLAAWQNTLPSQNVAWEATAGILFGVTATCLLWLIGWACWWLDIPA